MTAIFEHDWRTARLQAAGTEGNLPALRWADLRARMAAAHEAWREIEQVAATRFARQAGSFADSAARRIDDFARPADKSPAGVNPMASTNRKAGTATMAAAAGLDHFPAGEG